MWQIKRPLVLTYIVNDDKPWNVLVYESYGAYRSLEWSQVVYVGTSTGTIRTFKQRNFGKISKWLWSFLLCFFVNICCDNKQRHRCIPTKTFQQKKKQNIVEDLFAGCKWRHHTVGDESVLLTILTKISNQSYQNNENLL